MGARYDDDGRYDAQSLFETLGLDASNRFAVVSNPGDVSSLIGYYATFDLAYAAQQANLGPAVPTIIVNENHADFELKQSDGDLDPEWYDADHPDVWWRRT
jgi:hypothetical protein